MIPYGRQNISQADIDAVVEVLGSDYLTQGPRVPAFEAAVADYCGAAHGVAVNSATSALHIACLALGVGPGDVVWTAPNTFVASANCARLCGADVDFVDINPKSYCMDADALAAKLDSGVPKPKVIIPVHFAGQSADMARISELARAHGIKIIEDASHCIGGGYKDAKIGACGYSDICVFSFHPVKIITTAEGGVATTNDPDLATKMGLYRSHGVTRDPALLEKTDAAPWEYEQVELGLNYRMTEMQAALGLNQMNRLDAFVARRHVLARRYDDLLSDLPLVLPWQDPQSYSALHLYPIQIDPNRTGITRLALFKALRAGGIGVNVHYIPVHTQPYYTRLGFKQGDFPVAEDYYANAISIPLYFDLTESAQDEVVSALTAALS